MLVCVRLVRGSGGSAERGVGAVGSGRRRCRVWAVCRRGELGVAGRVLSRGTPHHMGNYLSGPPETTKFQVGQWVMVRRNGNRVGKMWLAQVTKAEYKLVDRGMTSDPVSGSANGDTWAAFYDVNFHDGGQEVAEESWCSASDPPPDAPAAEPSAEPTPQ